MEFLGTLLGIFLIVFTGVFLISSIYKFVIAFRKYREKNKNKTYLNNGDSENDRKS